MGAGQKGGGGGEAGRLLCGGGPLRVLSGQLKQHGQCGPCDTPPPPTLPQRLLTFQPLGGAYQ